MTARPSPLTRSLLWAAAALTGFAGNSLLARVALGGGHIDASTFTLVRLASGAATLAVLLIEQNVAEALEVADHVYVLDHGDVAFSGSPATVLSDERLRAAYLGATSEQSPSPERNAP